MLLTHILLEEFKHINWVIWQYWFSCIYDLTLVTLTILFVNQISDLIIVKQENTVNVKNSTLISNYKK